MAEQKKEEVKYGSAKYFALCGFGGILSCGLTHTAVTPIDLVKCNAQANPLHYPKGMFGNMGIWAKEHGFRTCAKGWAPTGVGYSLQGLGKFGLYEVFKYKFSNLIGKENAEKHRTALYIASSASAEFFADIMLCPWETVKLKVQTQPGYGHGIRDGTARLLKEEGVAGAFQILPTLWGRQIPYTIIKFVAFERIITWIYAQTDERWSRPKHSYNKAQQLGFTFVAGYSAGIICGAVSHPADTMATLLTKSPDTANGIGTRLSRIYSGHEGKVGIGFKGLWKGFGPRVVMIGTLTALQWFIYDSVKVSFGIPTTGAVKKASH